jgi:hypothetical protein
MALVSVILMLTVLMALAHVFVEKVWQSTRQRAEAASKEQVFWAAQAGLEYARQQLATSYVGSGGWRTFLTASTPQAYPAGPAWETEINGLSVEVFLRDNLDGDGDEHLDNDLKIFVLACARGRQGTEVLVESLCGFERPSAGGHDQSALPVITAGSSLSEQPVSNYDIAD